MRTVSLTSVVLLLLYCRVAHGKKNIGHNILKFDEGAASYVKLNPNYTLPQKEGTVCGWVKKLRTGNGAPCWFDYTTSYQDREVMALTDIGYYYIFGDYVDVRSSMTVPRGMWKLHCFSWSQEAREFKMYFDGDFIGKHNTREGRMMGANGKIALGVNVRKNGYDVEDPNTRFAGELYQVNIFDKQLNDSVILKMNEGGLCADIGVENGLKPYISWEEILLEEKIGNVTEVGPGCNKEEEEEEEEEMKKDMSRWDILYAKPFYNEVLTTELIEYLKSSWDMLDDFVGSRVTEDFIQHFKSFHGDQADLENNEY